MQTLKTAIVVVLLLVVFYGVYEMLNRPPGQAPPEVAQLAADATAELDIDLGDFSSQAYGTPATPSAAQTPNVPDFAAEELTMSVPPLPNQPEPSPYGQPQSSVPAVRPSPPATPDATMAPVATTPAQPGPQPPAASPASDFPVADSSVVAIPGTAQLQHNPYVDGDVVPKPAVVQSDPQRQIGAQAYQRALKSAKALIAEGDHHAALSTLSVFYKSPDLSVEEHRELLNMLDPLAGHVVYSREHLVAPPYKVRGNETLMDVARQYNVPFQLLQKINGIKEPSVLLPDSQLKVIPGPFRAEVDLEKQELTLFLDRLYAGRFPISLGADPQPIEGAFHVRDKQHNKAYFAMDGRMTPADSPTNPYGQVWLDLGREVCIHGSPLGGADEQSGCISLSPRDADDVFSILSIGSAVRILR